MKKITSPIYWYCIFALTLFIACNNNNESSTEKKYGKATQELVEMLNNDDHLKTLLNKSIEKAKENNPDKNTNPAQSLEEYFEFVSKTENSMPWELIPNTNQNSPFENTFQSIVAFYFIIDQPLSELENKELFNNTLQYYEPFAKWLTVFNRSWQTFLDSEDSWSDEYNQLVLHDTAFGLTNGWYEDPSNWKTFNQFFARYLSSEESRPIASPDDPTVVVSFADAVPQGIWAIDSNSSIVDQEGVAVKTSNIKQIKKLLGEGSKYKDAFANGTFTHSFLNINDYHRYHFPMSGTIKEARIIEGISPTGGYITWNAEQKRYEFNPSSVNWQMLETRGCVILETDDYGLVALLPIGMASVSSVNFEDNIKVGQKVNKGDMLGYFLFGGSDFIMIFQDKVAFELDAPKTADGQSYQHLLVGERLGHVILK